MMGNNISSRFIGCFDFLGFTELVRVNPLETIVEEFQATIQSSIEHATRPIVTVSGEEPKKITLARYIRFSDTIIFYTQDMSEDAFFSITETANLFITHSLANGFPVRGALTRGELHVDDRKGAESIVGQALIDAYRLEQAQDWCGAIISDEMWNETAYPKATEWLVMGNRVSFYKAPMKQGPVKDYACIEWPGYFINAYQGGREPDVQNLFAKHRPSGSMISWDVERKIRNTKDFLEHCRKTDNLPDHQLNAST